MLLVHGMLAGRALWTPNLAALAGVATPVVVELWGHGRSASPTDPAVYHPDAYVAALDRIREELGFERWFVCGQSFGASLTLRYALDRPQRVIAQAFTNSISALGDAAWIARMRDAAPAMAESVERGGHAALDALPIHPRHAKRLSPEVKTALLADSALLDPAGLARTFRFSVPGLSVRERIHQNRVPALLVCGERETAFTPCRAYAAARMPGLEVVGCEAGHAVNLEAAEAFNVAVTSFLRRHRG